MDATSVVGEKSETLSGGRGEATLRVWAAVKSFSPGRGRVTTVASAGGLSRTTIDAGCASAMRRRAGRRSARDGFVRP
jgi:hypothetical protein